MSDNRLLSDEELYQKIFFYGDLCTQFQSFTTVKTVEERNRKIREEGKKLFEVFNTQKHLYAESVIGEDERPASEASPLMKQLSPNTNRIDWRNELRAEQRDRIN